VNILLFFAQELTVFLYACFLRVNVLLQQVPGTLVQIKVLVLAVLVPGLMTRDTLHSGNTTQ
jgi:hypothetical protein